MDAHLKGKVVLITGASGGIGSGIARKFADEGARLVLHYRTGRRQVNQLAAELKRNEVLVIGADLAEEGAAKDLIAQSIKRFGRIDTMVANAASWETRDVPLHQMSSRQWHQTFQGVLTTTFYSVREFLRMVARQRQGNLT